MLYRIAGIDVHKKMLDAAVADVQVDSEYQFQRRKVRDQSSRFARTRRLARRV